ncbi:MAG: hypothetical protein EoVTN8_406 [Fluviibacter phosphoraccumulans EoVTN8]
MIKKLYSLCKVVSLYFIFLQLVDFFHFKYFSVNVLLYASLFDVVLSVILTIPLIVNVFQKTLDGFGMLLVISLLLFFGYSYAITIPTIIDRSLSVYILEQIKKSGGEVSVNEYYRKINYDYFYDYKVPEMRLSEQLSSGTIEMTQDGMVKLTTKGKFVTDLTISYRKIMMPTHRLIIDKYENFNFK